METSAVAIPWWVLLGVGVKKKIKDESDLL